GAVVGGRGPVADEPIRFRPEVSVGFPPTDVRRITVRPGADGEPTYQIDVTFMGLYGVSTPLPLHYAISILRSVQPYSSMPTEQAPGASADHPVAPGEEPESTPARDWFKWLNFCDFLPITLMNPPIKRPGHLCTEPCWSSTTIPIFASLSAKPPKKTATKSLKLKTLKRL
ncbi:type VI secretion system baseplate subunit TssG, partial [bacterium]|nr:type VI secretion system baseplate subunit TssG [bacterium]